jgi:hypothetical protein
MLVVLGLAKLSGEQERDKRNVIRAQTGMALTDTYILAKLEP